MGSGPALGGETESRRSKLQRRTRFPPGDSRPLDSATGPHSNQDRVSIAASSTDTLCESAQEPCLPSSYSASHLYDAAHAPCSPCLLPQRVSGGRAQSSVVSARRLRGRGRRTSRARTTCRLGQVVRPLSEQPGQFLKQQYTRLSRGSPLCPEGDLALPHPHHSTRRTMASTSQEHQLDSLPCAYTSRTPTHERPLTHELCPQTTTPRCLVRSSSRDEAHRHPC